jgi:hypothetical protein
VSSVPSELSRQLRALPDANGNLIVMGAFGQINWQEDTETVHPLLVYSEMLHDGSERAREAAEDLYTRQIAPLEEEAS